MNALNPEANKISQIGIYIASALGITMLLFYIDEGFYDFNWMMEAGNWLAFAVYSLSIFAGQILVSEMILFNYKGKAKMIISIISGAAISLFLLISYLLSQM